MPVSLLVNIQVVYVGKLLCNLAEDGELVRDLQGTTPLW